MKKFTSLALIIFLSLAVPIVIFSKTDAQALNCNSIQNQLVVLTNQEVKGSLFIKLPKYSPVDSSKVKVYLEGSDNQNNCMLLGEDIAITSGWAHLSNYISIPSGSQIVVSGDNLGAEPYAAAAQLLIVNSDACTPSDNCYYYSGFGKAVMNPNLISGNTDQVAVYYATPITNLNPTSINYFDNGLLVYKSNKLADFNKNYLNGGKHNLNIQVVYPNYEKLNYQSSVNMGPDWSKWLLIRSTYFKSKIIVKIILITILLIILALIGLAFYHFVIKRIRSKGDHGFDHYQGPDTPVDPSDNITVG